MKKILLFGSLCVSLISLSQTAIINPVQDNSIYSESTNSNGLGKLYSGTNNGGSPRRALIEFDIAAAVPAGATITAVSLDLIVDQFAASSGNDVYNLHPITTDWGEGTSSGAGGGAVAVSPDATWVEAMVGASPWTTAGGDFGPVSASQTLTASNGTFTWSAATMITDVQNWLDTPGSNFGWMLIGNESTSQNARRFGSSEQGTAPVLNVTYTLACTTPPNAVCQNATVYLDGSGNGVILDSDLDNGSTLVCGTSLSFSASQTTFNCSDIASGPVPTSLVISAVYDATLTGGLPKGVELYVINDIPDLSIYGLGSANNGGGTDGVEFTFPAVSATAGDYIYVASESPQFTSWFGFAPDYTSGSMLINGDDAVELFENSVVIDVFGDINVDGNGQPWEYLDGWAHRVPSTGPDGATFTLGNWTFSGPDVLDGETSNATAATPVPVGTYTTPSNQPGVSVTLTVSDDLGNSSTCSSTVVVLDTLPPAVSCVGTFNLPLDGTGNATLTAGDLDNGSTDGCGIASMTLSQSAFTCADIGTQQVMLYVTDNNGLVDSCMVSVTIDGSAAVTITSIVVNDVLCNGFCDGDITVNATGATSYSIDNGVTFQASNIFTGLCANDYDLLVSNGAGCDVSQIVTVNEPPVLLLDPIDNDTICNGTTEGTITLNVSGGTPPYSYNLDALIGGPVFTAIPLGGPYTGSVTDANGCVSNPEQCFVIEAPVINVGIDIVGCVFTCQQNNATYQWIDCADSSVIVGETGQSVDLAVGFYPAEIACVITDAYGCSDTTDCLETQVLSMQQLNGVEVSIFPNPTSSVINVALIGNTADVSIILRDVNGKEILADHFMNGAFVIDASALENGIYFIDLISNESKVTERIIVQH